MTGFRRVEEVLDYENQRLLVYNDRVLTPAGAETRYMRLQYRASPRGAVVVPRIPDGRLLLLRVNRYPIGKVCLEFPRGTCDAGEEPEHAARRELQEETRLEPLSLTRLGLLRPDSGIFTTEVGAYLAELPGGALEAAQLETNEAIEGIEAHTPAALLRLAAAEELADGISLAAFALLLAHQGVP